MTTSLKRKKCSGFTLTELVIVMGVIGAIIGAIWWATSNANEMRKDNDAFNEVQTVVQNIDTLMSGQQFQSPANTVITSSLITSGAIPSVYANAKNAANCGTANSCMADNPWSPDNFIVVVYQARKFYISIVSPSKQGCIALISQTTACESGQAACPIKIETNNGLFALNPDPVYGWQTPAGATASNISNLCANAFEVQIIYSL